LKKRVLADKIIDDNYRFEKEREDYLKEEAEKLKKENIFKEL